ALFRLSLSLSVSLSLSLSLSLSVLHTRTHTPQSSGGQLLSPGSTSGHTDTVTLRGPQSPRGFGDGVCVWCVVSRVCVVWCGGVCVVGVFVCVGVCVCVCVCTEVSA